MNTLSYSPRISFRICFSNSSPVFSSCYCRVVRMFLKKLLQDNPKKFILGLIQSVWDCCRKSNKRSSKSGFVSNTCSYFHEESFRNFPFIFVQSTVLFSRDYFKKSIKNSVINSSINLTNLIPHEVCSEISPRNYFIISSRDY